MWAQAYGGSDITSHMSISSSKKKSTPHHYERRRFLLHGKIKHSRQAFRAALVISFSPASRRIFFMNLQYFFRTWYWFSASLIWPKEAAVLSILAVGGPVDGDGDNDDDDESADCCVGPTCGDTRRLLPLLVLRALRPKSWKDMIAVYGCCLLLVVFEWISCRIKRAIRDPVKWLLKMDKVVGLTTALRSKTRVYRV